jgi:hypothetical protein
MGVASALFQIQHKRGVTILIVVSLGAFTVSLVALPGKRILRLGRLRLRGPRGAQDEFVLAAIARNLRRLATLVARPPPIQALCIA